MDKWFLVTVERQEKADDVIRVEGVPGDEAGLLFRDATIMKEQHAIYLVSFTFPKGLRTIAAWDQKNSEVGRMQYRYTDSWLEKAIREHVS